MKKFVSIAYQRAHDILATNRDALVRISEALLDREVLDAAEVKMLMEGKPLPEFVRPEPRKPSTPDTVQVLKPQSAPPGIPPRERPQPA